MGTSCSECRLHQSDSVKLNVYTPCTFYHTVTVVTLLITETSSLAFGRHDEVYLVSRGSIGAYPNPFPVWPLLEEGVHHIEALHLHEGSQHLTSNVKRTNVGYRCYSLFVKD
ncbi:jg15513 [Pararge aegeria aegeria]|uniref:Jg15513 protein n=1 Tax=Pararge aegeria aegeria TaxID=348720 RepID=A0A8S4RCW8_9NEOP|nr:jg15513 [Pararge aegeria aegeria]